MPSSLRGGIPYSLGNYSLPHPPGHGKHPCIVLEPVNSLECPLTIIDRIVTEDRSPLGILLVGRATDITIDMQGIDNIGVLNGIIANRRPPSGLGRSTPG